MQDPTKPTEPFAPSNLQRAPELLSNPPPGRGASRAAATWHGVKVTGRCTALVLGFLATSYYLKTAYDELSLARQERNYVLTAEMDKRIQQQLPDSTPSERQKIALAEDRSKKAWAEVAGQISYRQTLAQRRSAPTNEPKEFDG